MRATTVDPLTDRRWERLLDASEGGSIFHHPRWLRLLHEQYGYRLSACCVAGQDGELAAGLPLAEVSSRLTGRRLVALPFSDVCPPLLGPNGREAATALGKAVDATRSERHLRLEVHEGFTALPSGHLVERFYQHLLELRPDAEAIEREVVKREVRRAISKARRAGLTTEIRTDRTALDAFYRLHVETRKRLGVPTQPRRFIRAFEGLFRDGLGFVMLVRHGREVAAAGVFLTFNGTLTYKYGASDQRHLAMRPNNLLFRDAIGWGCENGCQVLDFGRTDLENEGLRRFKRGWGSSERLLAYTFAPEPPRAGGPRLRQRALTSAIQHSPARFGRLVGEALYKHYG